MTAFGSREHTSGRNCPHDAQAQDAARVRRRVPVATRRPAVPGATVPAAAPVDARGTGIRADVVGHRFRWISRIPVPAPLMDIPMHIIQVPGIRQLASHNCCPIGRIDTVNTIILQCLMCPRCGGIAITEIIIRFITRKRTTCAGSGKVFPFPSSRQSIPFGIEITIDWFSRIIRSCHGYRISGIRVIAPRETVLQRQQVRKQHRLIPGVTLHRIIRSRADCLDAGIIRQCPLNGLKIRPHLTRNLCFHHHDAFRQNVRELRPFLLPSTGFHTR